MTEIQGTCDDRFSTLPELLQGMLDSGQDLGLSAAVVVEGEPVVDLWGGWADPDRTTPWGADTVTNVWSTTKTMTNLSALVLADRGAIDLDAPVADYWPEFAAAGKEGVLVRHILSHTSGVSGWEQPITVEDLYDGEAAAARLAAQAPWWEPGSALGYHALNQGHLVGEVIRRVDGRSLGAFFREEIAEPLGADFWIGTPAEVDDRIAAVVPPPPLDLGGALPPDHVAIRTLTGPLSPPEITWTEGWRRAEIGAANGHGNARSVARVQSVVSNGGTVDGITLLGSDTIDRIFEPQGDGLDQVIFLTATQGIGYALASPDLPWIPTDGRVCFWGGYGGSMVVNHLDSRTTAAFMMNKMQAGILGNESSAAFIHAVFSV